MADYLLSVFADIWELILAQVNGRGMPAIAQCDQLCPTPLRRIWRLSGVRIASHVLVDKNRIAIRINDNKAARAGG
jgi:hypothetical protein